MFYLVADGQSSVRPQKAPELRHCRSPGAPQSCSAQHSSAMCARHAVRRPASAGQGGSTGSSHPAGQGTRHACRPTAGACAKAVGVLVASRQVPENGVSVASRQVPEKPHAHTYQLRSCPVNPAAALCVLSLLVSVYLSVCLNVCVSDCASVPFFHCSFLPRMTQQRLQPGRQCKASSRTSAARQSAWPAALAAAAAGRWLCASQASR